MGVILLLSIHLCDLQSHNPISSDFVHQSQGYVNTVFILCNKKKSHKTISCPHKSHIISILLECLFIHLSVHLSCSLFLNHWVEFNQTCCMTSPNGKAVREQHYFSICPFVMLLTVLARSMGTLQWHAIDCVI